jgi:beta-glucanase (GH16 family)
MTKRFALVTVAGSVVVAVAVVVFPVVVPSVYSGAPSRTAARNVKSSLLVRNTSTSSSDQSVPTASNCGGEPTLVDDGITWTCTFDSEFTGSSLDLTKWMPMTTAASGYTSGDSACFEDSPANVSVGNGYLSLTAREEAAPFLCQDPYGSFYTQYTSGYVTTYKLFSQTYGRFEVMAKVPAATAQGLQSSFWLYPESLDGYGPWPMSGEIDIAETYSDTPGVAIPYIHYLVDPLSISASTDTNTFTNDSCVIDPTKFNDYVLEWTPTSMTVTINGNVCLVDHWIPLVPQIAPQPFNQPFFINLTQALGIGLNQFDPSTTPLPATTEIKYVRVWQGQSWGGG